MFITQLICHCEELQQRGNLTIDSYYHTICEITDFFAIFAIVLPTIWHTDQII